MHDFTYYAQILISGLTIGSLYALIAIGYTMVYGILRLINFAHGDMFMVAGFIMIISLAGAAAFLGAGSIAVGLILTPILTVVLGVMIEKKWPTSRCVPPPRMSVTISAIGVSYLLQNLSTYVTGGLAQAYPQYSLAAYRDPDRRHHRAAAGHPHPRADHPVGHRAGYRDRSYTKMGMAMRAVAKTLIPRSSWASASTGSFPSPLSSVRSWRRSAPSCISATSGRSAHHRRHAGSQILRGGGIRRRLARCPARSSAPISSASAKHSSNPTRIFPSSAMLFTFALLIIILLIKPNGLFGEKLKEKV